MHSWIPDLRMRFPIWERLGSIPTIPDPLIVRSLRATPWCFPMFAFALHKNPDRGMQVNCITYLNVILSRFRVIRRRLNCTLYNVNAMILFWRDGDCRMNSPKAWPLKPLNSVGSSNFNNTGQKPLIDEGCWSRSMSNCPLGLCQFFWNHGKMEQRRTTEQEDSGVGLAFAHVQFQDAWWTNFRFGS